jgi:hydroxyethylthiazole kinase-like sugar kinase family protein
MSTGPGFGIGGVGVGVGSGCCFGGTCGAGVGLNRFRSFFVGSAAKVDVAARNAARTAAREAMDLFKAMLLGEVVDPSIREPFGPLLAILRLG